MASIKEYILYKRKG